MKETTTTALKSNPQYQQYAAQFEAATTDDLIRAFNTQVASRAWSSQRAAHDAALIDEFHRRGIDISVIQPRVGISFAHRIGYDETARRLVIDE